MMLPLTFPVTEPSEVSGFEARCALPIHLEHVAAT